MIAGFFCFRNLNQTTKKGVENEPERHGESRTESKNQFL